MIRALLAPRLLGLHLLAILAVGAAVLLGLWQYDAWQEARIDRAAALVDARAEPLDAVLDPDAPFPGDAVGQPVELSGEWLPDSTFYVDGRRMGGRSGVWAVTPVAVCDSGCAEAPAVLVVRGWAPDPAAAPAPPEGPVVVTGWLQPAEGSGASDSDPGDDVLPKLRIADAIQRVDQDLYGGFVIAREVSTAEEDGLAAVTPASLPKPSTFTAVRNLLYALEWWVFGAFAGYVWWRWCRDEVSGVTGVPSGA